MSRRAVLSLFVLVFFAGLVAPAAAQTGRKSSGKPRAKAERKPKAGPSAPSFETRRADWIRRKEAANAAGTSGPDPLEQYLVGEVLVTGLFETDGGFGVFLYATPTGNTFFATNGAKLFNGRLVSIERKSGGFGDDAQIVFEERSGKGAANPVVKRVVAVPSKVEEEPPPPAANPETEKPADEKPPLAAH